MSCLQPRSHTLRLCHHETTHCSICGPRPYLQLNINHPKPDKVTLAQDAAAPVNSQCCCSAGMWHCYWLIPPCHPSSLHPSNLPSGAGNAFHPWCSRSVGWKKTGVGNNQRLFLASQDICESTIWSPRAFTTQPAKHASKPSLGHIDILTSEREKRVQ